MRRLRYKAGARRVALIVGAAIAVAACKQQGEVYDRPPAEIRDLLRTVEVPLYMFGNSTDTQVAVDSSDPAKVVWKISADDSPLMAFTATLVPNGETKTWVVVGIKGAETGKYKGMRAQLSKEKEVRNLYLVSMTEAVDSTLDGRAYDITATYSALMTATAATAGRLFPLPSSGNGPSETENRR